MERSVIIDCFPESAKRYKKDHAIVVIDVIRATTTATTAINAGRKVYPVKTADEAFVLASKLNKPLMVGELGGNMPYGFDLTNSPVQVVEHGDINRPMILVSSSGTQLLLNAEGAEAVYISCFRNFSAVAKYVSGRHKCIAILGAGSRGQFRREDQVGCAWLGAVLSDNGYRSENKETESCIKRWKEVDHEIIAGGRSSDYLRATGQDHDLEFILQHIDDLDVVPALVGSELISMPL